MILTENIKSIGHDIAWSLRFVQATFAMCVMFMLFLVYELVIDGTYVNVPAIYWAGSFDVQKDHYYPGEQLWMRVVVTKAPNIIGKVSWSMIGRDGYGLHFEQRNPAVGGGCHDIEVPILTIPENTPLGRYHLEGVITYEINFLRTISMSLRSDTFDVIAKGGGGPGGGP
jgi:hypothetical protein